MTARGQAEKGAAFAELHRGEPFVIPNPWDAGTAKVLAALGFKALATTSAGFAFTIGRLDGDVTLEELAAHVELLAAATELPLSVDLEDGFGPAPEDAAAAIRRVAEAGAVGGSIEDYGREDGFFEISHAAERIAAAHEAASELGFPFTLTARAENYFRGREDLEDTIARLQAYERAGADVLYAPRLPGLDEVRALAKATSKPLNVLTIPGASMAEMADAGAQRVSMGGKLAWAAVESMADAAIEARDRGDFSSLRGATKVEGWLTG